MATVNTVKTFTAGEVLRAADMNTYVAQVTQVNNPNAIINGAMEIAQRGISVPVSSTTAYTLDRWKTVVAGNFTIAQVASGFTSIRYALRFQRDSGQTNTTAQDLIQGIETANAIAFAGKSVTLSFYARAGANYSPVGAALSVALYQGTGTDQNPAAAYTGQTAVISSSATLTTSWQRFTYTGSVPSTATELKPIFSMTGVGTAGAADYYEITGVQLEQGTAATSFKRSSGTIQGELAACQRYFHRCGGTVTNEFLGFGGRAYNGTIVIMQTQHPVTMRTTPAPAFTGTMTCNYKAASVTSTSFTNDVGGPNVSQWYGTFASVFTAGEAVSMAVATTASYLDWSAEL